MKGLSKSEKLLIGILLFVLVGYFYNQYVITPITNRTHAVQSRVDNYEQQVLQAKLMEANNKKMAEEISTLKEEYEKYMKLMPKSDMNAEVIRQLNKIAVDNKVTLTSLTLGNGVEYTSTEEAPASVTSVNNNSANTEQKKKSSGATKIMSVPVSVNIKGDYGSFMAFFNSLENSNRVINISSVNVTKQGNTLGDNQLSIALNASVLYVQDGTSVINNYDFNNGSYSKVNPFK